MKKSKLKKALAVILSAAMITSVMSVAGISAGAQEVATDKNYYVPSDGTETTRVYFYMPDDWYNEYTDTAGVYWWEGTDACPSWADMYAMQKADTDNIYYIDVPVDVNKVIFNNYVDAGEDTTASIYSSARQTVDIQAKSEVDGDNSWVYFPEENGIPGDSDLYTEGLASVDGMVFVISTEQFNVSPLNPNPPLKGEWYYYYGNGEYGFAPEKGDIVYTGEYQSVDEAIADKNSLDTDPTETSTTEIIIEPTTIDGTSNCVIEPEEDIENSGNGELIDPPFEEDTTGNTEPTEEPTTSPTVEKFPIEEKTTKIYFDVESSGWKYYKNIYCHIWRADGTGEWPSWHTRKELCTKEEDGRYSYDTTKTGNAINREDGKVYCVIFSADTGAQTYNMIMSGSCLGDTAYVTGVSLENPVDSEKKTTEAAWYNNPECGSQRTITSTGNIIGTAHAEGTSDATLMADYLIAYYLDDFKMHMVEEILNNLNLSANEALEAVGDKLDAFVAEEGMTKDEAGFALNEITEALSSLLDPDYSIPDTTDIVPTEPVTTEPESTESVIPSTPLPTEPEDNTDDEPVAEDAKIYFDVESSGWKNYKNIYCHIWRYDGKGTWLSWQTRKELCTKEADGKYSFTLSKTGNEFRYSDGNVYGVIFSADTGAMTYEVIMNGQCIGDTVYVTENVLEHPIDSEKKIVEAKWRSNIEGGTRKIITSTGNVIGTAYIEGESDETLMADYLITYYNDDRKLEKVQELFSIFAVDTTDVLYEVAVKENYAISTGSKTQEQADTEYAKIEKTLKNIYEDNNIIHDISGDKYTDVKDVTALQMHLANYDIEVKQTKLDVNNDGIVDVKDVTALQLYLASPKYDYIA